MNEKDPHNLEDIGFRKEDFGQRDPKELPPEEHYDAIDENLRNEDLSERAEEEEKKQKARQRELLNLLKNSLVNLPNGREKNLLLLLEEAIERRNDSESLHFATGSLRQELKGSDHSTDNVAQAILNVEIPELRRELDEAEAELDRREDAANDTATRTEFERFRDGVVVPLREETEARIKRLEELAGFLLRLPEDAGK